MGQLGAALVPAQRSMIQDRHYGLIELVLVFGLVMGWAGWQWWSWWRWKREQLKTRRDLPAPAASPPHAPAPHKTPPGSGDPPTG
jgi:hypothetical protein